MPVLLSAIFLNGCTSTKTQETLEITDCITSSESIVVLSELSTPSAEYSDRNADECLGKWLRKYDSKLKIIPAEQFRMALYPYFSAGTSPHSIEEYQSLINNRSVRARIQSMQVRYVIVQNEADTVQKGHGAILPFAGPGAGGVIGFAWWNRHTAFSAQIWDLKTGESKGDVKAQSQGTGILPALVLPIPIYLPATEKASCKELAKNIVSALKRQ